MTKKRILHCDNLNCPHERVLRFSDWVRECLPDSNTGFIVSDIDFILADFDKKKIIFLEIKTYNKEMRPRQKKMLEYIDKWIWEGVSNLSDWTYLGLHTIIFERTIFSDGKVFFDGKGSSEKEIKEILSFLSPIY